MSRILGFSLCLFAMGCSDGGDSADSGTDEAYDGEGVAWAEKSFEQRGAYMQAVVLPTMSEKFSSHDAGKYSDMNCGTCHGAGATSGTFEMPSADLPQLDAKDWPTGATATFMTDIVAPTMVDLLGAEPFDTKTGQGFGCYSCHTAK